MKAILVIDKPSDCSECPCCIIRCDKNGGYTSAKCQASYDDGGYVDEITFDIPSWCPLRPLPEQWNGELENTHPLSVYSQGMRDGFNMCLEEITE